MSLDVFSSTASDLRPYTFHAAIAFTAICALLRWLRTRRQRLRTTPLRGPPSNSFLYGLGKRIREARNAGAMYEAWSKEYGLAYAVPSTLGNQRIVLRDPKAIAHFYSKQTWTYVQPPFVRIAIANFFGKGLSWSIGETHRKQRKSLAPAFSVTAIRPLTSIFYNSAYKAKGVWDVLIESSGGDNTIIEVQNWMNHISLDSIGLAGFSHNFATLEGKHTHVAEVFDNFSAPTRSKAFNNVALLGLVFPFFAWIPTSGMRRIQKYKVGMGEISNSLLARTQKELAMGVGKDGEERSIIGLLIKAASNDSEFHLTKDEVIAQMSQLIMAGYETTSISLTWALIELSRNPDVQKKLRDELLAHGADPTYDQFTNGLPYLDAVVHEILRIHLPLVEITRVTIADDVIPLSEPVRTKSGELVDSLTIAKGTLIVIPMESINCSVAIWGEDAKIFRPSRWFEEVPTSVREIQGHRHLLTFGDGPRTCLGKTFALTEFKAVLTVLVKNYVFELRDGVDSKIEIEEGVLPRPKIAGEEGCKTPLRVRPYLA